MSIEEQSQAEEPRLNSTEIRILGTLVEKQATNPETYPLTLNALVLACNQKTSREPVMNLNPGQVGQSLRALEGRGFTKLVMGSRADRWEHRVDKALELVPAQVILMGLLFLRGPQTVNELLTRSGRMHDFEDAEQVVHQLERLIARGWRCWCHARPASAKTAMCTPWATRRTSRRFSPPASTRWSVEPAALFRWSASKNSKRGSRPWKNACRGWNSSAYANRAKATAFSNCSRLGRTPVYSTNCSSAWIAMTSSPVMTRLPSALARTISGVSDGIATTSNTVSAATMVSGSNANWSASGPRSCRSA